jgi:hypothetical protein
MQPQRVPEFDSRREQCLLRAKLHGQQFSNALDSGICRENTSNLSDTKAIGALSDQQGARFST